MSGTTAQAGCPTGASAEQSAPGDSTVRCVCYPDSVLFHVRLGGLTEQEVEILAETPGFGCRVGDDGICLVSVRFAHDVPSEPDAEALERRLRLALQALVPGAEIVDVRFGFRFARDGASPGVQALHRLRRELRTAQEAQGWEREALAELLTAIGREFAYLDDWLCNGGSMPSEWARRHPGGDAVAARQLANVVGPIAMAG